MAGALLERLTRYAYVKTLAFWVDATAEGKVVSKLFQRSGLLISDVTSGVEDSVDSIGSLKETPGAFMKGLVNDYDATNLTLYGRELSNIEEGEEAYATMLKNVSASIIQHMNERFYTILKDPVLKASCIFEHVRWPSCEKDKLALESYGNEAIDLLIDHYKTLLGYLGCDLAKAHREWRRLKLFVGRSPSLVSLSYLELYQRLFDQKGNKFVYDRDGKLTAVLDESSFYNILLIIAVVMTFAVDTSVCERGFALMNNLKTARRSLMGNLLLRTLMTICSLGDEWCDPTKIPVDEIVEEWRKQSQKGRYESAMWREAGLEEPSAKGTRGSTARDAAGQEDAEDYFEYDWAARKRARERAFPPAAGAGAGPSGVAPPAAADSDSDDSDV